MTEHVKVMNKKNIIHYISAANQTDYQYDFLIFEENDITVYINHQILTSGYSVSGLGQSSGGAVILDAAPPEGARVSLIRQLKIERTSDFQPSGEFRADVLNTELDYLTASVQDVAATANHSIRLDPTDEDTGVTLTLPVKAERANRWLAFDGQGNVTLATAPTGGSVVGGVSQWGQITGLLSAQSDLQAALNGKADAFHTHDGSYASAGHVGAGANAHAHVSVTSAGFMSPADKQKLDGIEPNATADQSGSEIVTLVNAELGGTAWQSGGSGTPSWGSISGTLSSQTDLQAALAGKADTGHDHTGVYAPAAHIHGDASTGTSGFMSPADKQKLDGIAPSAEVNPTAADIVASLNAELGGSAWQSGGSGTPTWGSISGALSSQTDLQAALAGKSDSSHSHDGTYAALSHAHTITDVTGLESALNGKSASGHDHDADYAAVGHSHSITDVTDLQAELDGKTEVGSLVSGDASNTVTADPKFWSGSQANYDAIGTKDSNTFYFIED